MDKDIFDGKTDVFGNPEDEVEGRTVEQQLGILKRKARARAADSIGLSKRLKLLERRVSKLEQRTASVAAPGVSQ